MLEEEEGRGNRGEDVDSRNDAGKWEPPSKPPAPLTLKHAQGYPKAPSPQKRQQKCCRRHPLALQPPAPKFYPPATSPFPYPTPTSITIRMTDRDHPTISADIWALTTHHHPRPSPDHPHSPHPSPFLPSTILSSCSHVVYDHVT